jgi:aminoglycoside phosphotransferase
VPQVLGYAAEDGREYLLLSAIPGIGTSSETLGMENLDVVRLLAQGLRMVHEVPIRDCPFDMTLDRVLPQT